MRLIANISLLFTELPMCDRFVAAADAGFDGVEIQFPYDENLSDIRQASKKSGMPVELINLPAGNRDAGDIGLAALPERRDEFLQGMELCAHWACELEVKKVNVLSGKADGIERGIAFETLVENLGIAAGRFDQSGIQVQLEVINPIDVPGFFASDLQTGLDAVNRVKHPNLRLQFDFYHMVQIGLSLVEAINIAGTSIGHVQFADVPGRHKPGSGTIDFPAAISALKSIGYDDAVSAEYIPVGDTVDSLDWMSEFRKQIE